MSARPEELFDWLNPDYCAIYKARMKRLIWLRAEPERLISLRAYYRTHIADFVNDWGITVDPRAVSEGKIAEMPFVLDPRQREWLDWLYQNWKDGEYGLTEKSRDVGCSWLLVGFSIGLCVLYENMAIGWGSFSQVKVDRGGDMGSLFEKGRAFIEGLPIEFRGGFDRKSCSRENRLYFPHTKSAITGEVGDEVGRGGRTSMYFVDEFAHFEHDQLVDAALSKNTPCRQDVSSVKGTANTFAQRALSGKVRKFTFHWRQNPRFTEKDYQNFLDTWGEVITSQELDISYTASIEGIIISQKFVQSSIDAHKRLNITPTGVKWGALDVADEGRDVNAFATRHGILVTECVSWSGKGKDIFDTTERAFHLCDTHRLEGFDYDADGLGAGVRGDATRIISRRREKFMTSPKINAYRGSAKVFDPERKTPGTDVKNEDRFQNLKAQAWASLAERFRNTHAAIQGRDYDPDNLISLSSEIKELNKLTIELSQPQWKYSSTGKLLVDKVAEGRASPNLADAICILFHPKRGPMRIAEFSDEDWRM